MGTNQQFRSLLAAAGMRKSQLARALGIRKTTVSRWGSEPPQYAVAYLEVLAELNRIRSELRTALGKALLLTKNIM